MMNSRTIDGVGFVFMKASASASSGVHWGAVASLRRVHSHPLTQPLAAWQWAQGSAFVSVAPRTGDVQRVAHSLTQAEKVATGVEGQAAMQADREPPGQPAGTGGEGEGEGGAGEGEPPLMVEPISPKRMLE